ncbi:MAG: putative quinol monooxygenase [Acidimicrobiales bacterium]|jgi:quinol monooxygenase YgiN|nr:putative quinol monooxygenase [Acidimicrobiales bacterium]
MSKVSLIAKLPTKPGKRDDLVTAFGPMLDAVNDEAGTEVYILNLDNGDENVTWVYELYSDTEAMGVHSGSDTMAALFGAIGDLLDGAPELIMTTPVAGKGL